MQSSLRSRSGPRIKYTPDESAYESISVDKLTPIIGGEIGGVDLRQPSNRQMDEIHRALAENLVIFFRDQHLSPEQHLDFGRKFGDPPQPSGVHRVGVIGFAVVPPGRGGMEGRIHDPCRADELEQHVLRIAAEFMGNLGDEGLGRPGMRDVVD